MNKLIKIDLNQTVSKTELKEKKADNLKWALFYIIILGFVSLIAFETVTIIRSNKVASDLKAFKNHLDDRIASFGDGDVDETSHEDIENLKKFEESKRIFWGPKLITLIELLPEDVAITKMQLSKGKNFKLEFYARFDEIELDNELTIYSKGNDILEALKNSNFNIGFEGRGKKNKKNKLTLDKSEIQIKKSDKLVRYVILGTINEILTKR